MKNMIIVCIIFIMLLCLVNYGIDYFFYLKNKYCRFHIGHWNRNDWEQAIEKRAIKWLRRTPTVKITDNSRYMLLDFLNGKYKSNTIQSWQKAALILGLLENESKEVQKVARKTAESLIDVTGNWKKKPVAVDCGMLSYAILKAVSDPLKIKPAMDYSIEIIKKSINKEGMISYTGEIDNPDMYVDTIGLYENTVLPNHAFHIESNLPLGVYGWGRGTAWYLVGLMDTYKNLKNEVYKKELKKWIHEAAEKYMIYQRNDGGFGSILQRTQTYDSSATATLAWFYGCCYEIFSEEKYIWIKEKCLNKLLTCTRISGAIDWCQGDTKDIGVFAQTYDLMPFAQGMALRAIN